MKTAPKYLAILMLAIILGAGAGIGIDSFAGYIFRSPFEWQKLPTLPDKPASISKIFLDNIYVVGESGAIFRCALMSEKCWSLDQSLIVPEFGSTYQYTQESFENCQISDIYFSTKSFWKGSIRDCGTSGPWFYGEDLTITTVVVIDYSENIWVYFDEEATFIDPIENIPPTQTFIIVTTTLFGGLLGIVTILLIYKRTAKIMSLSLLTSNQIIRHNHYATDTLNAEAPSKKTLRSTPFGMDLNENRHRVCELTTVGSRAPECAGIPP